jgi:hypothetical protein
MVVVAVDHTKAKLLVVVMQLMIPHMLLDQVAVGLLPVV